MWEHTVNMKFNVFFNFKLNVFFTSMVFVAVCCFLFSWLLQIGSTYVTTWWWYRHGRTSSTVCGCFPTSLSSAASNESRVPSVDVQASYCTLLLHYRL